MDLSRMQTNHFEFSSEVSKVQATQSIFCFFFYMLMLSRASGEGLGF